MQRRALFNETLLVEPAAAGRSNLQRDYRDSLFALAILVTLVLLIAIANLMTARAVARSREMAIRVFLGAARARLIMLVWLDSALILPDSQALPEYSSVHGRLHFLLASSIRRRIPSGSPPPLISGCSGSSSA